MTVQYALQSRLTNYIKTYYTLHYSAKQAIDGPYKKLYTSKRIKRIMKALKREAKILKKGDSKVTSRQKDRHKMGWTKEVFG